MPQKSHDDEDKPGRAGNGESSIYRGADGYWHGRVTMGTRDDGKPDRRHVKRKDRGEVVKEVRRLERERDAGTARKAGPTWTFEQWLRHWVEEIAAPSLKYTAARAYRNAVYLHLIPGLGAHRLPRMEPEHFEKLYKKMIAAGYKPGAAHAVHRVAVTSLNEAVRRGRIGRNPASLARPPRVEQAEIEPFEVEEIQKLIAAALSRRNGVRFVIALALGIRQGEALGIKWERLDRRTRTLRLPKQIQRHSWQHGCTNPHECGKRWHKWDACPPGCRHKKCPPPCESGCTKHGQHCPQRRGGGLVEVDVKSQAGKRGIGVPDSLWTLIENHERAQRAEREHAGTEWHDGGWMFTGPTGRPIDPRRDMEEWKELLAEAGLRDARLHDARHTAATVLLLLEVPDRAVMESMGWSDPKMLLRYQHVTNRIRRNIADRVEGLLWAPETPLPDSADASKAKPPEPTNGAD